mgnify:CR=1 FL=1
MDKFFHLKENNTTVSTEVMAGLTTFFAMSYIIVVNPGILAQSGMEWGAVFLATIIASIIGTLIMGLVANVPYAQAPGMGLNAFFVYTVCFGLGFTWQQALSMVFICGLFNIFITATKIRKYIIKSIPVSLQHAIGGGIGIFVAYIGLLNVGIISFDSGVPALATLDQPQFWVFLIGLFLTIVLLALKVKGARSNHSSGDNQFQRSLPSSAFNLPGYIPRRRHYKFVHGYVQAAAGAYYNFLIQYL